MVNMSHDRHNWRSWNHFRIIFFDIANLFFDIIFVDDHFFMNFNTKLHANQFNVIIAQYGIDRRHISHHEQEFNYFGTVFME